MEKINKRKKRFLVLICVLLLLPFLSFSQSESDFTGEEFESKEMILFEEIPSVFGASKYKQKVTKAPSSVSIVTADEIKKYGYRTLADILRSIRGFYITYDRNYHYLGIRGFGRPGDHNSRVLILINGHRTNDSIYDSGAIGTDFLLDVDLIDRVEVIRGPSSSIYGTSAFSGVINVITRRGRDLKGMEVSSEWGSFKTQKYRASYGNRFQNGLEFFLSGSFYDSQGPGRLYFQEFDDPTTNNGIAEKGDDDRFYSFFANAFFRNFTFNLGYVSREKGFPTAPWGIVFNDPRNRMWDEMAYLDLMYKHNISDQFEIMTRIFYDLYDYDGDFVYDWAESSDPPDIVVNKDYLRSNLWGGELQVTKNLLKNHKLMAGVSYRNNFRQDQSNYDEEPFYEYFNDRRDSDIWALFVQDEYQIHNKLILNVGLRHDQYDTFGGTTNPRIALIYNPFEKTVFKLLYGRAFRAPNLYELYYWDGGESQKPNPDLDTEKIRTQELVYEQYLGDHLQMVASVYYYKIKDLINLQTDPADDLLVFRNVEEIKAKGVELEFEGKLPTGIQGRISFAFQDSETATSEGTLTNSPRTLVKTNLIAPLLKEKVFAGAEVQYTSSRKTIAGNETDGFVVTNLTLFSQNLLKGFQVSASVYNLFDSEYGDPGSEEHEQDTIIQDGRTFLLNLTYKF